MQYLDFATVYGRLGNHPGDITLQQAEALFRCAMKQREGAVILEFDPIGGRSTVILGIAAKNLSGRLHVYNADKPQLHPIWMERAVRLHGLAEVATINASNGAAVHGADLVVIRSKGVNPHPVVDAKHLFVLGSMDFSKSPSHRVIEKGDGFIFVSCKNV